MTKRSIVATGLLVVGGFAGVALGQSAERDRAPRPPRGPALERELGLDPQQSAELRRMHSEERKQAIRRRADLAIARMELEEALEAQNVDEKLVASRVQAVAELQAAELRAHAARRLALRKVLTPEQRDKLRERRGQRGPRGRRPGGPGRFPGQGPGGGPGGGFGPTGPLPPGDESIGDGEPSAPGR